MAAAEQYLPQLQSVSTGQDSAGVERMQNLASLRVSEKGLLRLSNPCHVGPIAPLLSKAFRIVSVEFVSYHPLPIRASQASPATFRPRSQSLQAALFTPTAACRALPICTR